MASALLDGDTPAQGIIHAISNDHEDEDLDNAS